VFNEVTNLSNSHHFKELKVLKERIGLRNETRTDDGEDIKLKLIRVHVVLCNVKRITFFKASNIVVTLEEVKNEIYQIYNVYRCINCLEEHRVKNNIKAETKAQWNKDSIEESE